MAGTFIAIQTIRATTSPNAITFSNIPQTYKHLCFIANIGCDQSGNMRTFINGQTVDDPNQYHRWGEMNFGGSAAPAQYKNLTNSNISLGNTEIGDSNRLAAIELWYPNYSSTTSKKSYFYRGTRQVYNSAYDHSDTYGGGQWDLTAAITSYTFKAPAGTVITTGSNITLYGLA
jgi:hypothetical protein